jgi:hypothetical protein
VLHPYKLRNTYVAGELHVEDLRPVMGSIFSGGGR